DAIHANVQPDTANGLAVISHGKIVVSTPMTPEAKANMLEHVGKLAAAQPGIIDLWKGKDGVLYMGFMVPVFSIQGDETAASQIGHVVGIRPVGENFFGLLKHPGLTETTLEAV